MREAERIEPGSAVNAGRATPQRTHYIHPGEDFWARIREYCASMWPPTTPAPARRGTTPSCPTNASALAEFAAATLGIAAATLGIAGALLNAIDLAAASYLVWLPGNAAGLFFGISHARRTGRLSIAVMFAAYLVISLIGLFTWSAP